MNKIISFLCLSVLFAFILVGCSSNAEKSNGEGGGAEPTTIQLGHALSEGTPAAELIKEMAENVEEQTEGRVAFKVFPNSQLGSEVEMLEQIKLGTMGSGAIMIGSMQNLNKTMAIEDLPYMWADAEHARAAYDGEFGEYLGNVMKEEGMTKIGYLEWGFRHITNNQKPIVNPEDMKGMSIRVAETELRVDTFEEVGALPTVMAFSELYGALQQGTVDAQENPLSNIVAAKFDEVQEYLSLSGHFYNTVMMVVDTDVWEKISAEDQEIILAEADRISKEVRTVNDSKEQEYIDTLKERGMKVNDNVDKKAFREAMLPVYDKWEKEVFGTELMDIYRAASGY
ncbi:DctP family TRAP transporter solute-binding subunit [Fredinandcohnia onubensis]|uniref:DctP family TRAP transporter solute-binding subunit n=1 Tax=Fredinandcohnia onubensis TaxID=1571209 RepID=UPI001FEABF2B|nr:DctP family TRAP transporter solute-binding subunit [Fredinandcohnia onubensis]